MENETEPQPLSIDAYISAIKNQIDEPTPYTLEQLNPFDTVEELQHFSREQNEGAGIAVHFPRNMGFGEDIQSQYILNVLRKFFPRINTSINPAQSAQKVIQLKMIDHLEQANAQREVGGDSPYADDPNEVIFSMIQTKILHTGRPKKELVAAFKQALFAKAGLPVPQLIITGPMDPLYYKDFPNSYTFLKSFSDITIETIEYPHQSFTSPVHIPLFQTLNQRVLYALADFAYILTYKNKIEVCADIPIITVNDEYQDLLYNSNAIVDMELRKRNRLYTKAEVLQAGGLHHIQRPSELTSQDIQDIYSTYLNSPDIPQSEITLKESVKQVCERMMR